MFDTTTTREADVILPQNSTIEQDGTYTTCDRRIQEARQIVKSKTNIVNWQLIANLGKNFSDGFNYKNTQDIFNEICKVNRHYNHRNFGGYWGERIFNGTFLTENQKAHFSIYNTDLSTIPPEKPIILSSENYYQTKIRL